MARDLQVAEASCLAALDALVDLIDAAGNGNPGTLDIYANDGTKFDNGTSTRIVTIPFRDASDGGAFLDATFADTDCKALIPGPISADATTDGTAFWFEVMDGSATPNRIWAGEVGTAASDLNIANTVINNGATVQLNTFAFKMPRYSGD